MDDIIGQLETSIQAKLEADNDFQTTIASLSDEEKTQKITERKSEEINKELSSLKEGSEKAIKAQELADNYKIRAEKAELALKDKAPLKPDAKNEDNLSAKDFLSLNEAKVTSEDYDEIVRVSKILGKTVSETLKDATMRTILETRAEERRTAAAAHTSGGARGTAKVSGDDLLAKAERGEEVKLDADSAQAIFQARLARKLQKKK